MKENGFIASSLLYGMLALFLVIMISTLSVFANNKLSMDKLKQDALNTVLNQNCVVGNEWKFKYTGSEQTFTIPCDGIYTLEVWGAQGGLAKYGTVSYKGGLGGYATGKKTLSKNTIIYISVGGQGGGAIGSATDGEADPGANTGYNGGGYGCVTINNSSGGGGGGATHMATATGLLKNLSSNTGAVLLVAGGGGGGKCHASMPNYSGTGGVGGGTTGGDGVSATTTCYCVGKGGTQSAFVITDTSNASGDPSHVVCGNDGRGYYANRNASTQYSSAPAFGLGANYTEFKRTTTSTNYATDGGGGGGYYGGAAGWHAPGGGGSSYIGGVTNGSTKSGSESMPKHASAGEMTGNSGNGYAKITLTEIAS